MGGRTMLSTRRRARRPRAVGAERGGQMAFEVSATNLLRCWCSRASAGGLVRSAPHVGPQHNHAKSALHGACSVGGRPMLSTRGRARGPGAMGAERGGQRTFKVSAANLPRCWCSRASAGGLARSASHVGPQHNHARSALRGVCSVGGRPILSTQWRARGPGAMGTGPWWSRPSKFALLTCCGVGEVEP